MWGVSPDNIQGVIFIDEIDAHLHVSLQKQILRFSLNHSLKFNLLLRHILLCCHLSFKHYYL